MHNLAACDNRANAGGPSAGWVSGTGPIGSGRGARGPVPSRPGSVRGAREGRLEAGRGVDRESTGAGRRQGPILSIGPSGFADQGSHRGEKGVRVGQGFRPDKAASSGCYGSDRTGSRAGPGRELQQTPDRSVVGAGSAGDRSAGGDRRQEPPPTGRRSGSAVLGSGSAGDRSPAGIGGRSRLLQKDLRERPNTAPRPRKTPSVASPRRSSGSEVREGPLGIRGDMGRIRDTSRSGGTRPSRSSVPDPVRSPTAAGPISPPGFRPSRSTGPRPVRPERGRTGHPAMRASGLVTVRVQ